jgi:imidazolonepropionase-like amidohydrolase
LIRTYDRSTALQRDDIGVLPPGKQADIVAMTGDPIVDIAATEVFRS